MTSPAALYSFVSLAKVYGKRPVLIIDKANKIFGLGEKQESSSSTIFMLTQLKKEQGELGVILACTECDYPSVLEDNGLNLNDIEQTLYAGEVSPKAMWQLLVIL